MSVVVPLSVSSSVLSVVVLALQKYFPCTINYILYGQLYIVRLNNENSTQTNNTLCHSPSSPSSAVVDCYI